MVIAFVLGASVILFPIVFLSSSLTLTSQAPQSQTQTPPDYGEKFLAPLPPSDEAIAGKPIEQKAKAETASTFM